jgi:hypothetical protein
MAALARVGVPALSTGFGVLMVGLAAVGSHGPAIALGAAALTAMAVGTVFRPAATFAVLLVVLAIAVSGPSLVLVGLSGLCAVAYLVCGQAAGASAGIVMGSATTAVAALGFTSAGLVAASFPLRLPWLPLAAAPGALAIFVLATRPFTKTFDKR